MIEYKQIEGFENLYTIYSDGRVYSERTGKFLKPEIDKDGYLIVDLRRNGEHNLKKVHRLVASAFIPNPNNYPVVNHIDEDKANNDVSNLEWCTKQYNSEYSLAKDVIQYSQEGQFIKEWPSTREIERQLGYHTSNISKCCRGIYKQMYGYVWRYKT